MYSNFNIYNYYYIIESSYILSHFLFLKSVYSQFNSHSFAHFLVLKLFTSHPYVFIPKFSRFPEPIWYFSNLVCAYFHFCLKLRIHFASTFKLQPILFLELITFLFYPLIDLSLPGANNYPAKILGGRGRDKIYEDDKRRCPEWPHRAVVRMSLIRRAYPACTSLLDRMQAFTAAIPL